MTAEKGLASLCHGCSGMPLQERQRVQVELGDILVQRRVCAPFEDDELRIADAAPQSFRKPRRRQLIVTPERDLRRCGNPIEMRFHVVSEYGIGLSNEVRH